MAQEPSKMRAVKDKMLGGVKETLGTVTHAEGLKETGREQKREGDAEALAAGKGNKHYDPAMARKGVGIQHKHLGPNPKKHTEGPCAGCTSGQCQVGHDYDAALCHSCTQGHCDAHNVKSAGLGHDAKTKHSHGYHKGVKMHEGETLIPVTGSTCERCNRDYRSSTYVHDNSCPECVNRHNMAYDAAVCEGCRAGTCKTEGHSKEDQARMKKMKHEHVAESVPKRDLDKEVKKDERELAELDREDKHDMEVLAPKLHHVHD